MGSKVAFDGEIGDYSWGHGHLVWVNRSVDMGRQVATGGDWSDAGAAICIGHYWWGDAQVTSNGVAGTYRRAFELYAMAG